MWGMGDIFIITFFFFLFFIKALSGFVHMFIFKSGDWRMVLISVCGGKWGWVIFIGLGFY